MILQFYSIFFCARLLAPTRAGNVLVLRLLCSHRGFSGLSSQRWTVELGRPVRQRDPTHKERHLPAAIPSEDGRAGVGAEGDEGPRDVPEHHTDDRLSEGRPPFDLPEAEPGGRGEEVSAEVPGLQPLVPPRSARRLERDPLRRAPGEVVLGSRRDLRGPPLHIRLSHRADS